MIFCIAVSLRVCGDGCNDVEGGEVEEQEILVSSNLSILKFKLEDINIHQDTLRKDIYAGYLDSLDYRIDVLSSKMKMKTLGKEFSDKLDWSMPRLVWVAGNFTKYDEYAVKQINKNIDLAKYKKFGTGLLYFKLINSNVAKPIKDIEDKNTSKTYVDKTFSEQTFSFN